MRINNAEICSIEIVFKGEFNSFIGNIHLNYIAKDEIIISQKFIDIYQNNMIKEAIYHHEDSLKKLKERLSDEY